MLQVGWYCTLVPESQEFATKFCTIVWHLVLTNFAMYMYISFLSKQKSQLSININVHSRLIYCFIIQSDQAFKRKMMSTAKINRTYELMSKRRVKGFYNYISAENLRQGALSLLQTTGLGKLKPNTLLLGFKGDWQTNTPEAVSEYVNIIQ